MSLPLLAYSRAIDKLIGSFVDKSMAPVDTSFQGMLDDLMQRYGGGSPSEPALAERIFQGMDGFLDRAQEGSEGVSMSVVGDMVAHIRQNLKLTVEPNPTVEAWLRASVWIKENVPYIARYTAKRVVSEMTIGTAKKWAKGKIKERLEEAFSFAKEKAKSLVFTGISSAKNETQERLAEAVPSEQRFYLFLGPDDRITRPFCDVCNGYAFTAAQRSGLDNGQGLSVKRFCGGYNCRHTWVVITRAYAEERGIPLATETVIDRANLAARQRR